MSNRKIDAIITSQQWEIDPRLGLQALAQYLHECQLVESGDATVKDLYGDRREKLAPRIVGMTTVSGSNSLSSVEIPNGSTAVIQLSGVMRMDDGLSSEGVRTIISHIQAADSNPRISTIVLEIDSPGGQSSSGSALSNALQDVVDRGETTVVGYAHMMASAAVRGTLPIKTIYAAAGSTFVGSVGTMYSMSKEIFEEIREDSLDFYARQSTLKNHDWREMLLGNFEPLVDMLTENAQYFIDEVFAAREIQGTAEQIEQVESGKLFNAGEAINIGLIHGIGSFQQLLNTLEEESSTSNQPAYLGRNNSSFNQTEMSKYSLKSFIASIRGGLANVGIDFGETAEAEDVINAINNAKPITEQVSEQVDEQIGERIEASINTATESFNEQLETLNASITEMTERLNGLQEANEELESTNEKLEKSNDDLKNEVAKAKGKKRTVAKDGTSEKANGKAEDIGSFNTTRTFGKAVKPGNGSKYSKK